MNELTQSLRVGQISRPKLGGGFGRHVGVLLPDGLVAHMTPKGSEIVTLEVFAQRLPIQQDSVALRDRYREIWQRAWQSIGNTGPYDVVKRNCEHYATWLLGGRPASEQVALAVGVSIFAFGLWLLV